MKSLSDAIPLPPPPRMPVAPAPVRRPGSVRRTSSIDVDWPDGRQGGMRLVGRGRDALTPVTGDSRPIIFGNDVVEVIMAQDRTILSIASLPPREALAGLVGKRAGGKLRAEIADLLPDERRRGTPLYLLLDDLSGTSLVAPWAWSCWDPGWYDKMALMKADPAYKEAFNKEGVCAGLRPGSSGLDFGATGVGTADLRDPADPDGWHDFPRTTGPAMRRARRIDVWLNDTVGIDAAFQDSATTPHGPRSALHEYHLSATADPLTGEVMSLEAEPRVLPFPECPSAAANMGLLVGSRLADLRQTVLDHLRGIAGCTHLNDALRALAEVPILVHALKTRAAATPRD